MLWLILTVYVIIAITILYPLIRRSYFAPSLVLGNVAIFVLIFVLSLLQPDYASQLALTRTVLGELAFTPSDLQALRFHTIISSMFLHLGLSHIISNVVILYLLGLPLEERVGGPVFGAIYLSTGAAATVIYGLVQWGSPIVALGASGAIMGIAGTLLVLYPRDRIFMLLVIIIMPRVPVYLAVGVVAAWQFVLLFFRVPGIAVEAHLAGIGVGILLGPLIRGFMGQEKALEPVDLDDLATTEELKHLLEVIRGESVAEVREAWVDHFLGKARCPRCHGPMRKEGRDAVSDCGWRKRL
ncbi:MAG: rhomboid family intramembrane serine protease [Thermoplasmata archaeon]